MAAEFHGPQRGIVLRTDAGIFGRVAAANLLLAPVGISDAADDAENLVAVREAAVTGDAGLIKEPPNRVIGLGYALDEFLIDPGREGLQLSCAPKYLFAPCKLFLQKRSLPSITIRIDAASPTYRLHGKDHKRSGQANHPIGSRSLLTLKWPSENTFSALAIKEQN